VEKPDRVVGYLPKACKPCGRSLEGERAQRVVSKRQVLALPQPKRAVTEHQMGDIEGCGCVQQGADPPAIRGKRAIWGGRTGVGDQPVGSAHNAIGATLLPVCGFLW